MSEPLPNDAPLPKRTSLIESLQDALLSIFGFAAVVVYLMIAIGLPLLVIAALWKFVFG